MTGADASAGGSIPSRFRRLRDGIRALLEQNERDRLSEPRGWQHHLREVYASYFDRRRMSTNDPRRQRWQKQHKDA